MSLCAIPSPLGPLLLECRDGAVTRLQLLQGPQPPGPAEPLQARVLAQLEEYFAGKRAEFTLPLAPEGSAFDLAVWQALGSVPYGRVCSYGCLARALGRPGAARAVGNAAGRNPILILQPCHRLVAAGGLGGFSAGIGRKRRLLALEGLQIPEKSGFSEKFLFTFG